MGAILSHWPQSLVVADMVLTFALHCERAGRSRPYSPVACLIGAGISTFLLFQGGFFAGWGWSP